MIVSFANKKTELVANGICPKGFQSQILALSRRKLGMLSAALSLEDLRIPPANRLEKLQGDLSGYYSIRINNQFRIIFQFNEGKAYIPKAISHQFLQFTNFVFFTFSERKRGALCPKSTNL